MKLLIVATDGRIVATTEVADHLVGRYVPANPAHSVVPINQTIARRLNLRRVTLVPLTEGDAPQVAVADDMIVATLDGNARYGLVEAT